MPTPVVDAPRLAEPTDCAAIAETLAAAFFDDPVAVWACPDESRRRRMLRLFHGAYFAAKLKHDWVWTLPGRDGAALWSPPPVWRTSLRDDLALARSLANRSSLARMPLIAAGMVGLDRAHPAGRDHFYLAVLGVAPASQGRGLGSLLLAPTLEICDTDSVPAYLESSRPENVSFYERHGFRVTGEFKLPRGPVVYKMWRDPAH